MSDTVQTGILEQAPGEKSSKRYFGAALIAAGGLLLVAVGVVALFHEITDPETALAAGKALIITGAALLGVTVFEGIGAKIAARSEQ